MKLRWHLLLCGFAFSASVLRSQVLINEIQHANLAHLADEDGDFRDWFELYNAGSQAVNLAGYSVSDRTDMPQKWMFPEKWINPGQFLRVWASGKDRGGAPYYHTVIFPQDIWHYLVPQEEPDPSWRLPGGNVSGWASGPGGFGYGDDDDGTVVGPYVQSVYFRKSFSAQNLGLLSRVVLHMDYDDAFVAYLNGVEIARANIGIAGTPPPFDAPANLDHEAQGYQLQALDVFQIDPSVWNGLLVEGENVLAVQVHNTTAQSSDMTGNAWLVFGYDAVQPQIALPPFWMGYNNAPHLHTNFALSAGEPLLFTNPQGTVLNLVNVPLTATDHSYRREPDGGPFWCFTDQPTPGAGNSTSPCFSDYEPQPVFNIGSGLYDTPQTVVLTTASPGAVIRYTTDGSVPGENSAVYTDPLTVSASSVISARCFSTTGLLASHTEKNTYLIGETGIGLPVVCLSTNPENLWDESTGIYTYGPPGDYGDFPYFTANFWQNWERESYVEYFSADGQLQFEGPVGLKIHGGWSRGHPQKSFRVLARDDYGMESMDYPLIADKPDITQYHSFNLRNGGNNYYESRYHDALLQRAMKPTDADYAAYSPVAAFLNGEYWGVYGLRENMNEDYVESNHGTPTSESTVISYNSEGFNLLNGSTAPFQQLINYALQHDPQSPDYFAGLSGLLDIGNYADYIIAETYYGNGDWSSGWQNNTKFWHDGRPGGKWRFMLMDLDFGTYDEPCVNYIDDAGDEWYYTDQIFGRVIQNPEFRSYFIRRYLDLMNTVFQTDNLSAIREEMRAELNTSMPRHCERWSTDYWWWFYSYDERLAWNDSRQDCMIPILQEYFGLNDPISVSLNVQPAGSGRIHISTVQPDEMEYPWTGNWFNGIPVTLTAIANPGYTFSGWTPNGIFPEGSGDRTISVTPEGNTSFTATFAGAPADEYLELSEIMYHPDDDTPSGDWVEVLNKLEVPLDLSWYVFRDSRHYNRVRLEPGTLLEPGQRIVLAQDPAAFVSVYGGQQPTGGPWRFFGLHNDADEVMIRDRHHQDVVRLYYTDEFPWPEEADGSGPSMEYLSASGPQESPFAWTDGCPGGSPFEAFDPSCGTIGVEDEIAASGILCYPNPASDWLHADLGAVRHGFWSLTDLTGRIITERSFGSAELLDIDVSPLSPGLYLFVLTGDFGRSEHKIVIR
jgi:hypothetical protein